LTKSTYKQVYTKCGHVFQAALDEYAFKSIFEVGSNWNDKQKKLTKQMCNQSKQHISQSSTCFEISKSYFEAKKVFLLKQFRISLLHLRDVLSGRIWEDTQMSVGHLKISVVAANDEKTETLEPQQV
jgi:hypothetical protein